MVVSFLTRVGAFTPAAGGLDGSESDGSNVLSGGSGMTSGWATDGASLTTASATAPDGTTTAVLMTESGSSRHLAYQQEGGAPTDTTGTFSLYAKQGTQRYIQLIPAANVGGHKVYVYADLQTGTITDSGGIASGSVTSSSIQAGANGFWKITVNFDFTASVNDMYAQFSMSDVATYGAPLSSDSPSYSGTGTIYVWRPHLVIS